MPQSYLDNQEKTHLRLVRQDETREELVIDRSKVLVIGKSPINRVVVSKIVEKCGLRPVSESPDKASEILLGLVPGIIVLDGGADNKDCDALISRIEAVRRASGTFPSVILLSMKAGTPESLKLSNVVDAVVAKPITTESLQPVIDRLGGVKRG